MVKVWTEPDMDQNTKNWWHSISNMIMEYPLWSYLWITT